MCSRMFLKVNSEHIGSDDEALNVSREEEEKRV